MNLELLADVVLTVGRREAGVGLGPPARRYLSSSLRHKAPLDDSLGPRNIRSRDYHKGVNMLHAHKANT